MFMETGCINKDLKEVKKIHLNIWEEYECIFGGDDTFVNATNINSQILCIYKLNLTNIFYYLR